MSFALALGDTSSTSGAGSLVFLVIGLAVVVFYIAAAWKVFSKAGRPGWACLIPIYNTIVLLHICGRSAWWFILLCIPFVNIVATIIVYYDLARAFGKGAGFTIGLIFLWFIFFPILGFGGAQYVRRAAVPVAA